MDPALIEYCTQTVGIAAETGRDYLNTPTYDPSVVAYQARVEISDRLIRTNGGATVMTKGRCYLVPIAGQAVPQQNAQLTLPALYPVTHPPIVEVRPELDEFGAIDHLVIYFA